MSRLLLPFADQQIEIPSLSAGNIALTVGLKQVNLSFMEQRKSTCFLHDCLKSLVASVHLSGRDVVVVVF